jgi:hypothetical protein
VTDRCGGGPNPTSVYDEAEAQGKYRRLMAKHSSQILELARRGAEHRYAELKAEIASLVKHFPDLTERESGPDLHGSAGLANAAEAMLKPAVGGMRRRKMSAKARAAISAAQKARWAKKKAGAK